MRIPGPCLELSITLAMFVTEAWSEFKPRNQRFRRTRFSARVFGFAAIFGLLGVPSNSLDRCHEVADIFEHVFDGEVHLRSKGIRLRRENSRMKNLLALWA